MKALTRAAIALLLISGVPVGAETFLVRPDGTGDYPTIQAAVDAASDGDMILLADEIFRGNGNWGVWVEGKSLTIRSESGDPLRTVIDCEDGASHHRAFVLLGCADVFVQGISMINGDAGAGGPAGGAVNVDACIATLRDCIFAGNSALIGGAISARMCELSIISCTFYGNEAIWEGGGSALALDDIGSVVLSNCIVAFGVGSFAFESLGEPYHLECCDIYGNEGGDYVEGAAGQLGLNGNISEDPLFCDPVSLDLRIHSDSPCAPDGDCGLIGALPVGCGPTAVERGTWGAIKALYRGE